MKKSSAPEIGLLQLLLYVRGDQIYGNHVGFSAHIKLRWQQTFSGARPHMRQDEAWQMYQQRQAKSIEADSKGCIVAVNAEQL